ncbi:MAG: hypothetical protein C5B50_02015 [Verrucomicrobia bacterium]|nr:MAG: hypothetical protein C5B50_02015 [Verrucomicrobiota bacterium]
MPRPDLKQRSVRKLILPLLAGSLVLLLAGGCTNAVSARKVPFREAFEEANTSVLTSRKCSSDTRLVLQRFNLQDRYVRAPAEALRELHRLACSDERPELLLALAELNYLHGENLVRNRSLKPWIPKPARDYFLCSCIYAYHYLVREGSDQTAAFKPDFRLACDLYNVALGRAFTPDTNTNALMEIRAETRTLNPGTIRLELNQQDSEAVLSRAVRFFSADAFVTQGLTVHNTQGALGATLLAELKTEKSSVARYFPATLVLKFPSNLKQWSDGASVASLELSSGYENRELAIAGHKIPVRTDTTTPLAYGLNSSLAWKLGSRQFFSSEEVVRSDIYQTQPYQPGRVPVIFVHGTFSSPVWWAEMINTLRADRELAQRCQFWFYIYNSGNPILFTAANFRDALSNTVDRLDPQAKDPALRQMVVVGHSQGGLVAKLAVMDSGDTLWQAASHVSFEELKLKPKAKTQLQRCLFFDPVPYVKRVVFVSTPHRGSFLATSFIRNLAGKFMSLPIDVLHAREELFGAIEASRLPPELRSVPSSLSGMSPKNPVLLKIADTPLAPGVTAHSIIAVKGNGDPAKGNDGVVKYISAHVPYTESELIVRSGHSCQAKPATIEEMRRILLKHLASIPTSSSP